MATGPERPGVTPDAIPPVERATAAPGYFEPATRNFFGRMSDRAQNIANKAYESLYNVPVVNRLVAKLEISYNQFWIDRHESKSIDAKEKMDKTDLQMKSLDVAEEKMHAMAERLRSMGVPGVERLQSRIRDIEDRKATLLNSKDKQQSKFEKRDNKKKNYANRRDEVADKLISHYDEKLRPMESRLDILNTQRDRIDMFAAVMSAQHKQCESELSDLKRTRDEVRATMISAGLHEDTIRETTSIWDEQIAEGTSRLKAEKDDLAKRKQEINEKIAKVDKKANPKRDKREQFVRVKNGRPIDINVPLRERGMPTDETEEPESHTRPDADGPAAFTGPASPERGERLHLDVLIQNWNRAVDNIQGLDFDAKPFLDGDDFLAETGLSVDNQMTPENFKTIVEAYYVYKKIPMPDVDVDLLRTNL